MEKVTVSLRPNQPTLFNRVISLEMMTKVFKELKEKLKNPEFNCFGYVGDGVIDLDITLDEVGFRVIDIETEDDYNTVQLLIDIHDSEKGKMAEKGD